MGKEVERSKPLHNFSLPCDLSWGRRASRVKINRNGANAVWATDPRSSVPEVERKRRSESKAVAERIGFRSTDLSESHKYSQSAGKKRRTDANAENRTDAVVAKSYVPCTEANRMKDSTSQKDLESEMPRSLIKLCFVAGASTIGSHDLVDGAVGTLNVGVPKPNSSPSRTPGKSSKRRTNGVSNNRKKTEAKKKKKKQEKKEQEKAEKIEISLSRKEIEDDFLAITGFMPGEPNKRKEDLQKKIDTRCPGWWLTRAHAEYFGIPA